MASTISRWVVRSSHPRASLTPTSRVPTRSFTPADARHATITASPKTKLSPPPPAARNILKPRPPPRPNPKPSPARYDTQDLGTLLRTYRYPLLGTGLVTALLAFYLSATITATLKEEAAPCACAVPTGRPGALETARSPEQRRVAAEQFDKELRFPEWFSGVTKLRGQLTGRAVGDVLEVAVGTGRNLAFYDWAGVAAGPGDEDPGGSDWFRKGGAAKKEGEGGGATKLTSLTSFTGVDISADMMAVARDRLREAVPGLAKVMRRRRAEPMPEGEGTVVEMLDGKVRLVMGDAEKGLPSSSRGGKYDTVVQTFGLCSVADPARLLANAAEAVKPDTGRIILLEHGRGWFGWMNNMLDRFAGKHFARYGCWWNRDIERLVREAEEAVPGLEVVYVGRPWLQFGTMLYIELKLNSTPKPGVDSVPP